MAMQQSRATTKLSEEQLNDIVKPQRPRGRKVTWTLGNILMLCGVYVLLFVGGQMADERYNIYAASGTSIDLPVGVVTEPAPAQVDAPPPPAFGASVSADTQTPPSPSFVAPPSAQDDTASAPEAEEPSEPEEDLAPAPSVAEAPAQPQPSAAEQNPAAAPNLGVPDLNQRSGTQAASQLVSEPSTITRLVIPRLGDLDKKVVEVKSSPKQTETGQVVNAWQVDKYRVGHHQGTSNPGGGGNVVLSGHSGGVAYPFNDIYYLKAGDVLQVYSNGELFNYAVTERIVVDEDGQPRQKQIENARYIQDTDSEMVTMVTCWPLSDEPGLKKFTQRVIVRAEPTTPAQSVAEPASDAAGASADSWVAR